MKTLVDLKEFESLFGLSSGLEAWDNGNGTISIDARYSRAHMASCIVLLSTAIARYVEGAFIEMSQIILRISDEELPRYRKTLQRWGNPSSKNVSSLFARLGLFDLFTDEAGLSNASAHAAFLDEVNQKRNAAAHGLPNLETLIPEWTEGAVARSLREHTKISENDLNKALCNHLIKREIAI